jgi:N-acetylmuramoyl-L-alanine amidase
MPAELRRGSRGEAVRDLQARLSAVGRDLGDDEPGELGPGTEAAVRAFQDARGLRVDGVVGRHTWSILVESGFLLGDRFLYAKRPMFRGDDVADLQHRLNALGFDAGREDGILGDETVQALLEFQRAVSIKADGICGPTTVAALQRVGTMATESGASVRERERLRARPRHLDGHRVYVAVTPGLAALGEQVARCLSQAGADPTLDASGSDDSAIAGEANRFGADLFLALRPGDQSGCRCSYFSAGRFRSEAGLGLATAIHEQLALIIPSDAGVCGKAYAALRETRMTAVVLEVVPEDDVAAMRALVTNAAAAATAIVAGIQRAIEHPPIDE